MGYKIISDTGADFTPEMQEAMGLTYIPFKIDLDQEEYVDNWDLNLETLYQHMTASPNPVRTACPSPLDYEKSVGEGEETVFIVTITSKLSGSYNAAKLAAEKLLEKFPQRKIFVIDSKTASAGQTNVVLKLYELVKGGLATEEILEKIQNYIEEQSTYFILHDMSNLVKNGRIPKTAGFALKALNINPIMTEKDGEIELFQINRGFKRGLVKLAGQIVKELEGRSVEFLTITHAGAQADAEFLKKKVVEKIGDKIPKINIIQTKGLSSSYANVGGIVVGL
ncbi:MAG: DegV family protein [Tissierellia bacterium]|nr:DegV family protein [Tissierellia bacterium]